MENNRTSIILPILVILLIIVFMIPITGMLITPQPTEHLNTPIYELDNLSLNDVFDIDNDTEFTAFNTLGLSLSMNDIFSLNKIVNGTFIEKDVNYKPTNIKTGNGVPTYYNVVGLTFNFTSFNSAFYTITDYNTYPITTTSGGVFYVRYSAIGTNAHTTTVKISQTVSQTNLLYTHNITLTGILDTYSQIYTDTIGMVTQVISFYGDKTDNSNITYKNVMLYDLNPLGMSTLTKANMDRLYTAYLDNLTTYDWETWEFLFNFGLNEAQWDYYYALYVYYLGL